MRFAPGLIAVVAFVAGCAASTDDTAPQDLTINSTSGALTIDWTISGAADPAVCQTTNAAAIQVSVLNSAGQPVGSFQESCSAFATNIALDAGIYSASAILVDAAGAHRTTPVLIESFQIHGTAQYTQPIDFPTSSFVVR